MFDVLFENGELQIQDGDWKVGRSEPQEVELITCSHPGEFRQFPTLGFGLSDWLMSPSDFARFRKYLSIELRKDAFVRIRIKPENGEISVDAER